MKNLKSLTFLFALLSLIWACVDNPEQPVNPLIADAGEEQEITSQATAVLDGRNSRNALNEPMSFSWRLIQKPNGATFTHSSLNQVAIQFSTDTPGDYKFELTVSYQGWSDKDEVLLKVTEGTASALEAKAGQDKGASLGNFVQLDGTQSKNETGEAMTYLWEFVQRPMGSTAIFGAPTAGITIFQADKEGEYLVKLTVKAGNKQSSSLVKINVTEAIAQGPVIINEDILADRTLTDVYFNDPTKLDYLVTKDVAIRGAKLTIEPGVRIGFEEGTGFVVEASGALKAYSMDFENKPIIFQGKEPLKGYWDGISIYSTQGPEYLNGLEVRDAGKLGFGIKVNNGAKMMLNRSKVHHNLGVGVWFDETSNLIEFRENHLFDNEVAPLKIPARLISDISIGNQIKDKNIQVTEGRIFNGLENYWPIFEVGYDVLTDLIISHGSSLVLSHGTRINMANDKAIQVVNGSTLKTLGSQSHPVKIEGMTKVPGSWKGIYIDNSQSKASSILYAHISHAGSNPITGQNAATIKLGNGASLKLNYTTLDQGNGHGFEARGINNNLEFKGNTIKNIQLHPIFVSTDLVEKLDFLTRMENNGVNEVAVDGFLPLAKDGAEIVWKGFAERTPYVIKGASKDLTIQSGMRIREGVTIKMNSGSRIHVQNANGRLGYLTLDGIEGNPVIIKGTAEDPGFWYGITYSTSNPQNIIRHAIIQNAGKMITNNFSAAITLDTTPHGSLMIQHSKITHTGLHGIAVSNMYKDFLIAVNLTFEGIPGQGIFIWN
jgi:hypothetical protein